MLSRKKGFSSFVCSVLAVYYLLISTNLLFIAMDWTVPITKTIEGDDFPCADYNCACKTAEKCKNDCCCFPKEEKEKSSDYCEEDSKKDVQATVSVSLLSSIECKGENPGKIRYKEDSYKHEMMTIVLPNKHNHYFTEPPKLLSICKDPPEKVPIG